MKYLEIPGFIDNLKVKFTLALDKTNMAHGGYAAVCWYSTERTSAITYPNITVTC